MFRCSGHLWEWSFLDIQLNNFPVKGLSTEMGGFACRQPKKSQFSDIVIEFPFAQIPAFVQVWSRLCFYFQLRMCMATEVYLIAR